MCLCMCIYVAFVPRALRPKLRLNDAPRRGHACSCARWHWQGGAGRRTTTDVRTVMFSHVKQEELIFNGSDPFDM